MSADNTIDYYYEDATACHTEGYLWEPVVCQLRTESGKKVFDLGCGNGAFSRYLIGLGYEVEGVDPSEEGIRFAKQADPASRLQVGNAYEPLKDRYGRFS